jgi:hypothetical protein
LKENRPGVEATLDFLRNKNNDWVFSESQFTWNERRLISRVMEKGDFKTLWDFFQKHVNRQQCLDFVIQLQHLTKTKDLRRSFLLFTFINDSLMRELAQMLLEWEASGEWDAFLEMARTWLSAAVSDPHTT